jgi:serine/threonine-protein kinase
MESERVGRYTLFGHLGSGGMAAVYLGRDLGQGASPRVVAIKRLHAHIAASASGVAAFLDEARVTEQIRHPNVVALLEVVSDERELALVMEYVHGVPLAHLWDSARRRAERAPIPIVARIVIDMLRGLEAAHRANDENGQPLGIVHRDVSPQNVLVGADGVTRLLDFGIATGAVRLQTTRDDQLKGKLRYMAPEQLQKDEVTPLADLYATAVVFWEMLTGEKLFVASSEGATMARVLEGVVAPPSELCPGVPPTVDAIVLQCLSRARGERLPSCAAMADAISGAVAVASAHDVSEWVTAIASDFLSERQELVRCVEEGRAGAFVAHRAVAPERTATLAGNEPPNPPPLRRDSSSEEPSAAHGRGRRVALFSSLFAVLALAAVALVWSVRRSPPQITRLDVGGAAAAASPPVPSTPPAPPVAGSSDEAKDVPPTTSAAHGSPRPPRPTTPKPRPDPCKPKYVTGPDGIRRVKPECL